MAAHGAERLSSVDDLRGLLPHVGLCAMTDCAICGGKGWYFHFDPVLRWDVPLICFGPRHDDERLTLKASLRGAVGK